MRKMDQCINKNIFVWNLNDNYFQEPDYDHMVFINRREGLVPLSSLCKDDVKSVMSSNVKLLKGRNVRLGKPRIFVKDNGRLVAVGGSRGEIFIETTVQSRFSDIKFSDYFSIYYIKSFDLVTVFEETKSVTKSRLHL